LSCSKSQCMSMKTFARSWSTRWNIRDGCLVSRQNRSCHSRQQGRQYPITGITWVTAPPVASS
jgi:hypothetical protein